MSLDKLSKETVISSESTGSSSSTQRREIVPYLVVYETDCGLEYQTSPQDLFIVQEKDSSTGVWKTARYPEEIERFWIDRNEVSCLSHRVQSYLGDSLWDLLEDDPRKALEAVKKTVRHTDVSTPDTVHRDCAVCKDTIHLVKDTYTEVNSAVVCDTHRMREIETAGLL